MKFWPALEESGSMVRVVERSGGTYAKRRKNSWKKEETARAVDTCDIVGTQSDATMFTEQTMTLLRNVDFGWVQKFFGTHCDHFSEQTQRRVCRE